MKHIYESIIGQRGANDSSIRSGDIFEVKNLVTGETHPAMYITYEDANDNLYVIQSMFLIKQHNNSMFYLAGSPNLDLFIWREGNKYRGSVYDSSRYGYLNGRLHLPLMLGFPATYGYRDDFKVTRKLGRSKYFGILPINKCFVKEKYYYDLI